MTSICWNTGMQILQIFKVRVTTAFQLCYFGCIITYFHITQQKFIKYRNLCAECSKLKVKRIYFKRTIHFILMPGEKVTGTQQSHLRKILPSYWSPFTLHITHNCTYLCVCVCVCVWTYIHTYIHETNISVVCVFAVKCKVTHNIT
jgi:hypothetical protein